MGYLKARLYSNDEEELHQMNAWSFRPESVPEEDTC